MGLVFSSQPRYVPVNRRSIPEQIKFYEKEINNLNDYIAEEQSIIQAVKRGKYLYSNSIPSEYASKIMSLPDAQRKQKFISYSKDAVNRYKQQIRETQQKLAELKSRQSSVGKHIAPRRTPRQTVRKPVRK